MSDRRSDEQSVRGIPIFTAAEKARLQQEVFRDLVLDGIDFIGADLRHARFERCSLRGAVFERSFLVGTRFLDCDLRAADFNQACWGNNRFDGSWLTGATGLSEHVREQVRASGGLFLLLIRGAS